MAIYNMTLSTTEPYNNVGAVTVRQDDHLTQTFIATIVENGVPKKYTSGYQVFFNALFDGNIIARDLAEFNYGTSVATYTLKDSFFQQTGEVEAYFSFEKDGKRDSTANFSYYVTQGNCRNIRQGNYIYELEELFAISDDIIKNKDFTVLLEENRKLNAKLEEVKSGFDVKINNVFAELSRYEARDDNPHNVTAEQVGAYDKKTTDEKDTVIIEMIERHKEEVADQGWKRLTLVNEATPASGWPPSYRVIGKQVEIYADVGSIASRFGVAIATIPKEFAPSTDRIINCVIDPDTQFPGIGRAILKPDGQIIYQRPQGVGRAVIHVVYHYG